MEDTPRFYDTLVQIFSQHQKWLDLRHLKTLAWMMVGLMHSELSSLTSWAPYVQSRAVYAQSTVRRFARWLNNPRIESAPLYGPRIAQALADWREQVLYLALDTSLRWNTYCMVRLAVISRGRAISRVRQVLEHPSSSVRYDIYTAVLDEATKLLPRQCKVIFLADRGFTDTHLMAHLTRLGWHWRIRMKKNGWIYRRGHRRCKLERFSLTPGQAWFWPDVLMTEQRYGPVPLAMARCQGNKIEENFIDDKSNGFQLESSLIRSAQAVARLCLVLAMTTLYLVSQGTEVVKQGKRRWVDRHWFRGQSYLKIGWNWVKLALTRGYELVTRWHLGAAADQEPARASKHQPQKPSHLFRALEGHEAVA